MRKIIRITMLLMAAAGLCVALLLWIVFRAARQAPPFYTQAMAIEPASQKAAGQQFERSALELHNQVQRGGRWTVRFTQDEINGWLAAEMPAKFPKLLPSGISEPRVAIAPRQMQLALRYGQGPAATIVSLTTDVYLTAELNELAIRIVQLRAGTLPVPLGQFQAEVAQRAARAGYPLRWTEVDGDPVALMKLAQRGDKASQPHTVLEALDLGEGELTITGTTEELESKEAQLPVAAQPPESATRQR